MRALRVLPQACRAYRTSEYHKRLLMGVFLLVALLPSAYAASVSGSSSTDVVYTQPFVTVWSPIVITGAPTNGQITSVTFSWNVDANYVTDIDYYIDNSTGYYSPWYAMTVTGDDWFDGYSETSDSSRTLYPPAGTQINGTWWFNIQDVYDDSNNDWDTGRIDSWSITIYYTTPPDLEVKNIDATAGTYQPGDQIDVSNQITNVGGSDSGTYVVDFYASTNTIITTSDYKIGHVSRSSLASGGTHNYITHCSFPPNAYDGTPIPENQYYIGAILTCGNDTNSANDKGYDGSPVAVSVPDPYLDSGNCYVSPSSVQAGGQITAYYRIYNPRNTDARVGLGCSVKPHGTSTWLNDVAHDDYVTVPPGYSTRSRAFDTQNDYVGGSYDVAWGLWETIGSGAEWDLVTKDNQFTVTLPPPDLTPYKPSGWSDKIVVSGTSGTNTDSNVYVGWTAYIDYSVVNDGDGPVDGSFWIEIWDDTTGQRIRRAQRTVGLPAHHYYETEDVQWTFTTAGLHRIRIKVDADNNIPNELIESNNECTREIDVKNRVTRENEIPGASNSPSSVPTYRNNPLMYGVPQYTSGICFATAMTDILAYWDRNTYGSVTYWNLIDHGKAPLLQDVLPVAPGHDEADVATMVVAIADAYYDDGTPNIEFLGDAEAIIENICNNENGLAFSVESYAADTIAEKETMFADRVVGEIDAHRPLRGDSKGTYFTGAHSFPIIGYKEFADPLGSELYIHRNTGGVSSEYVNLMASNWGAFWISVIVPGGEPNDHYEDDDSQAHAKVLDPDHIYNFRQTHNFKAGILGFGDDVQDWVKFSAVAGRRYTVETEHLGPRCDTLLQLDWDGATYCIFDDDGADEARASRIIWDCYQNATAYILVWEKSGRVGHDTNYDVAVTYENIVYPTTPTPIAPPDDAHISDLTPRFEWSAFQNGGDGETQSGYQVRVRCDTDGDTIVYDTGFINSSTSHAHVYSPGSYSGFDGVSGCDRVSDALQYNKHYHWHARYRDSGGDWSAWSADTLDFHQDFYTVEPLGALTVNIYPSDVRSVARWRLTGGPDMTWKQHGETISNIPTGNYTLQFNSVTGWDDPEDRIISISEGANSQSGTYVRQTGTLTVNIYPTDVRGSARWRLTSGPDMNWKQHAETISGIPMGSYTLQFSDVADWVKPGDRLITVSEGANTADGIYTQGTLAPTAVISSVTPSPADPRTDTVQFREVSHDNDEGGAAIQQWRWSSDVGNWQGNGTLSTQREPNIPANDLAVNDLVSTTHTITLWVQDDEGQTDTTLAGDPVGQRPVALVVLNAKPTATMSGVPTDPVSPGSTTAITLGGHDKDEHQQSIVGGEIKLDGVVIATPNLGQYQLSVPISEGLHEVAWRVRDDEGAWSDWVLQSIAVVDEDTPDLSDTSIILSPEPDAWGQEFEIHYSIENLDDGNAGAFRVGFYLSENDSFDPGTDVLLDSMSYAGLAAHDVINESLWLWLPPTSPFSRTSGTFYIVKVVDDLEAVPESNEANNVDSAPFEILGEPGVGLLGEYFNKMDLTDFVFSRIDPTIDFFWPRGTEPGSSPDPSMDGETFSVRWTGQVKPRYSEPYTFYIVSDDGMRLWVQDVVGAALVDDWSDHSARERSGGPVALTADQWYDVKVEYYDHALDATAKLYWSSPSQPKEIIPQDRLRPMPTLPDLSDRGPDYRGFEIHTGLIAGEQWRVWMDVLNDGLSGAGAFKTAFYLSEDMSTETPTDDHLFFTKIATPGLGAEAHTTVEAVSSDTYFHGYYYVWAHIDVDGEVEETNETNNKVLFDDRMLFLYPDRPLVVTPNGGEEWERGAPHDIQWILLPFEHSGDVTIELWKADQVVATLANSRPAVGNWPFTWSWAIPNDVELGTDYRIRVIEEETGFHDSSDGYFSIVGGSADLADTNLLLSPEPDDWGQDFDVHYMIENLGGGDAGAFRVGFYLSEDDSFDLGEDVLLENVPCTGLSSGAMIDDTVFLLLPESSPFARAAGRFYIVKVVDDEHAILEPNEQNNIDSAFFDIVSPWTPWNGHEYRLGTAGLTWPEAEAEAIQLGGHLVTVDDEAENSWVWSTYSGIGYHLWIGFNDEQEPGHWVWASGSGGYWSREDPASTSYVNWHLGEPGEGLEHYAAMPQTAGGGWHDFPVTSEIDFRGVIEKDTGGTGLLGEYFHDMALSQPALTRIDPTVNFTWPRGTLPSSSPDPSMDGETFSVRWTGQVKALYSETYTFYTVSDDGVRLWVNGVQLVNNWTNHGATENRGVPDLDLVAGQKYDIKMEYYDNTLDATAKLLWESPSQPKQIIPQECLYPAWSGDLYALTVNSGIGDGSYAAGMVVSISADAPAAEYLFEEWIGDTASVADIHASNTTLTMPASAITVTATYAPAYVLTVTSGSGDGQYCEGDVIAVTADGAPAGQEFDRWVGDTDCVADCHAAATAVTMPAADVTVTASYMADTNGTGLLGEYFDNMDLTDFVFSRIDPEINFTWPRGTPPDPRMDDETFSVRWTGQVKALYSETYTFYTVSDDGVRLWVDGQQLVENGWTNHAATENRGLPDLDLVAGQKYDIKMEYYDNTLDATAKLLWESPSQPKQIIPQECLYPAVTPLLYVLTVNSGTGDGSYTEGAVVPIVADAAPAGQAFDRWTGDVATVADINNSSTNVTMPAENVTVTATYSASSLRAKIRDAWLTDPVDYDDDFYMSSVNENWDCDIADGMSGTLAVFEKIHWKLRGTDTLHLYETTTPHNINGQANEPQTVPIPKSGVTFPHGIYDWRIEVYRVGESTPDDTRDWAIDNQLNGLDLELNSEDGLCELTVNNGSGDGWYVPSALVPISADAPPAGQVFDKWTGDTATVTDVNVSSTTVTIVSSNMTVTATYKDEPGPGTGLMGEYYHDMALSDLALTRVDPTVNFTWPRGTLPSSSPDPSMDGETFSVRWTGQVEAPHTCTYTFYTLSDDGVRLWVNGTQLVNNWTNHGATENSGSIPLEGGQKYDIVMEYYDNTLDATAKLLWSCPHIPKEIIPQSQLYPAEITPSEPLLITPADGFVSAGPVTGPFSPPSKTYLLENIGTEAVSWRFVPVVHPTVIPPTWAPIIVEPTSSTLLPGEAVFVTVSIDQSKAVTMSPGAYYETATFENIANDTRQSRTVTLAIGDDGTGLRGDYFHNMDLTNQALTRIDPTVNFTWPRGTSPDPSIHEETFSVRWTGQVKALYSETYTFYTVSDDGVRLWVNGTQLVNNWTNHGAAENSGSIALVAGQKYDIVMEYYDNTFDATAKLLWSSPSQAKQVIPQECLYPN